jgi:hypothetical protein
MKKIVCLIHISLACLLSISCATSSIPEQRKNYLKKKYKNPPIDTAAFNSDNDYYRYLDKLDNLTVAFVENSKQMACDPKCASMNEDQYWNELLKRIEPQKTAFVQFCLSHYIMTSGTDDSIKQHWYPFSVKLRNETNCPDDTTNKTFIEIKEPDQVREFGEPKYDVSPGDILEVIHTKTCRSGSGICWKVRNIKTGELGYVFAERMKKRHRVYERPAQN